VNRPAQRDTYEIIAQWDSEAGVWVAQREDVPGLVAEAESPNLLAQKLNTLIPELLEANGVATNGPVRLHIQYRHDESSVIQQNAFEGLRRLAGGVDLDVNIAVSRDRNKPSRRV
jgi:predicted RNase H-like HicB family nuclease